MEQRPKRTNIGNIDGFVRPEFRQVQRLKPSSNARITRINVTQVNRPISKPIFQAPPDEEPQTQPESPQYSSYQPASQYKTAKKVKEKHKWTRKRKTLTSVLVVLLVAFGVGGWYGSKLLTSVNKVFHSNVFSDVNALLSTTKLKGENQGRVNILLAGDSTDDPGHQGADLTDSIMVLSIDTRDHTGFMLSIPRDLWVDIPGQGHGKINDANTNTSFSQAGYPNGGMGQLEQIVQTDLGIPIDYYALINYGAFKDAVDAVDGITVDIQSPDPRGIYDAYTHLKLPNGQDALDGQEALDLARARGDDTAGDISYGFPNSDFDRTQHQRQMLVALLQKSKTLGVVANPIKVSQLFDSFTNNVQTDLNLQDVLRFVQVTKGINISHLQSLTYQYGGQNSLITDYDAPDGEDALIPTEGVDEFGQLQQYYQQLTSNNPVVREAPSVMVLNASNVDGLAHKVAMTLTSEGFNVVGVSDALNDYQATDIIDLTNNQKPAASQLLKTILPKDTTVDTSTASSAEASEADGYNANFVLVLGQDAGNIQQP